MGTRVEISRHAKRRMKLYDLDEAQMTSHVASMVLTTGKHVRVEKLNVDDAYPTKMVIVVQSNGDKILVTAFPFNKGKRT